MCVNQTSKIFISTKSCFVYKVVNKLRNQYYSCVSIASRIPQKRNIKFYAPDEWEETCNYTDLNRQGTNELYVIDQEKTSSFPGFYCFNTEKDARNYIKEFKYIDNTTVLMCLVPKGTRMFKGTVEIWLDSCPIPSINVFKLTPIRELVV